MIEGEIITRFAPSPTGRLHLGNLRTALFNALLARSRGGRFLLRIEDTDARRGEPGSEDAIREDLAWLGLDWDEPRTLRQSERFEIYGEYYERLLEQDGVYPCFCTEEELRAARRAQAAAGQPPRYSGTCARLNEEQRRERLERGLPASLRFRVPGGRSVAFDDLVRGEQRFESDALGDFVIRRSDGSPAFLFANAVDDALSGVTVVLRGEDHVANTPRQIMLLVALGLEAPRYGHLPLVVGRDGTPLSKRRGAASVAELRGKGWLPLALSNYLARLGHHYEDDGLLDMEGLAAGFDPGHLGRSPAHFDQAQLRHWQRLAVVALDQRGFASWASEAMRAVPAEHSRAFTDAVRPNCLFPGDVEHWARVLFGKSPHPSPEAEKALNAAGPEFLAAAARAVRTGGLDVKAVEAATGRKGRNLFMPLRAALTGETHGPELAAVLELLGKTRVVERLERQAAERSGEAKC